MCPWGVRGTDLSTPEAVFCEGLLIWAADHKKYRTQISWQSPAGGLGGDAIPKIFLSEDARIHSIA